MRLRASLAPLALVAALSGCAPLAAYRGPAPGVPATFGGALPGFRGDAEPARHHMGSLEVPAGAESVVVVVYGDNRPGLHVETWRWGYAPVHRMAMRRPGTWLSGMLHLPVFLVRALLPALEGPRDLVAARLTHRPDGGGERRVLAALASQLPATAVLSTGDLVTDGRRGRLWQDFVARHRGLRGRVPFVASPGNHERLYDAYARAGWDAAVGPPPRPGRYWWTLDLPGGLARFVFLDSNVLTDARRNYPDDEEQALAREQLDWADSALAGPFRFKLVVLHHPVVSTGRHAGDWGPDGVDSPAARRKARLLQLCLRHGVSAILAGHEHLYHRVRLRTGEGRGFWQVTSGGGGSPLYPIDRGAIARELGRPLPEGLAADSSSAFGFSAYHVCRLVLPGAGSRPATRARLDAYRVLGGGATRLLDRIELDPYPEDP